MILNVPAAASPGWRARFFWVFALGATMLLTAGEVSADVILLKNGRRLEGTVVRQDRTSVIFRVSGKMRTVSKSRIRRIVYARSASRVGKRRAAEAIRRERRARALREREAERRRKLELARQRKEQARKAALARAQAAAKRKKEAKSKRSLAPRRVDPRRSALWRSALLPGWGQLNAGDARGGWRAAGSFGLAATVAWAARLALSGAEKGYKRTTSVSLLVAAEAAAAQDLDASAYVPAALLVSAALDRHAQERYKAHLARHNAAFGVALIVYLAQLGHAWFFHPDRTAGGRTAATASTPVLSFTLERERAWRQAGAVRFGVHLNF